MKLQVKLSDVAEIITDDLSEYGSQIIFRRKKRDTKFFKMQYAYRKVDMSIGERYCPKCGNLYQPDIIEDSESSAQICNSCKSDEYEICYLKDLPELLYSLIADNVRAIFKLWDGKTIVINPKEI